MGPRNLGVVLAAVLAAPTGAAPAYADVTALTVTRLTDGTGQVLVGFRICARGAAATVGDWKYVSLTTRSEGTWSAFTHGYPNTVFDHCFSYATRTPAGSVVATFTYHADDTADVEVAAGSAASIVWFGPGPGDVVISGADV